MPMLNFNDIYKNPRFKFKLWQNKQKKTVPVSII